MTDDPEIDDRAEEVDHPLPYVIPAEYTGDIPPDGDDSVHAARMRKPNDTE